MQAYDAALQSLNEILAVFQQSEALRKKFSRFSRFVTIVAIGIAVVYSIYLLLTNNFSSSNYGLAWLIVIFLVVLGWAGKFLLLSRNTKFYHKYLASIESFSDALFATYSESNVRKVEPFISEESNPEYLELFELGFSNDGAETQEHYLTPIDIYYFELEDIPEAASFFNTTDVSKHLGQKLSEQFDTSLVKCINLPVDSDSSFKRGVAIYTSKDSFD